MTLHLEKDPRLLDAIERLRLKLGATAFDIVDHWADDLLAVGIASPRNHQVLIYFSVCSDAGYDVELELPPLTEADGLYRVAGRSCDLTFAQLAEVVAGHLALGFAPRADTLEVATSRTKWSQVMPDSPRLVLLVLKTGDVPRLRKFYACLGVEFIEERHGSGPLHYAGQLGDLVLEIYPLADGAAADRSTRFGFDLSDLDATLHRLAEAGTTIRTPPTGTPWGRRAVVIDPDGRSVELVARPNPTGEV